MVFEVALDGCFQVTHASEGAATNETVRHGPAEPATLAQSPNYRKAVSMLESDPMVTCYVNPRAWDRHLRIAAPATRDDRFFAALWSH